MLLGLLCLLQLGTMLSLLAGGVGLRLVAPLALLATLIAGFWLAENDASAPASRWIPPALTLGVVGLALALSRFYVDLSWDGQWYHQTGILRIAAGWNPVTDPMHAFAPHLEAWVRHYPKGPWYAAAAVFKATGHIETGKCSTWITLAASFLAAFAALLELGLRRLAAGLLAAVAALNPVVTSELTGFMVDGIMAASLLAAIAATVAAVRAPRRNVIAAAVAASIVAINAKFTGLAFLCVFLAATLLWVVFEHRVRLARFALLSGATLLVGVFLFGYNPYVTNTVHVHQPLYPVLGSANFPAIDHIERGETPRNLRGRNRLVRMGYSLFGRPGNQPYFVHGDATLMWPFAARPADLYAYTFQETRVAGLGPWFSGCLLLSLALAAWLLAAALRRDPSAIAWPALACAAILVSLLLSRHLWWPRYGPQMGWLPLVPLIVALQARSAWSQPRSQRAFAWVIASLLIANALLVAGVRMHWETTHTLAQRQQLAAMHASGKRFLVSTRFFADSATQKLAEAGIPYDDAGMKKLPHSHELTTVVEHYPDAIHYLAADEVR